MSDTAERLLKLKEAIDEARTEEARLEGRISQLEQQRATDLGCSSDEEAVAYRKELVDEIGQLAAELEEGVKAVEEELGWTGWKP